MPKQLTVLLFVFAFLAVPASHSFASENFLTDWVRGILAHFQKTDDENFWIFQSEEDLKLFREAAKKIEQERTILLSNRKELLAQLRQSSEILSHEIKKSPAAEELQKINELLIKEYDLLDENGRAVEARLRILDEELSTDLKTYISQAKTMGEPTLKAFHQKFLDTFRQQEEVLFSLTANQERLLGAYDNAHFKMRKVLKPLEKEPQAHNLQKIYAETVKADEGLLVRFKENEVGVSNNYLQYLQKQQGVSAKINDRLRPLMADRVDQERTHRDSPASRAASKAEIDLEDTGWKRLKDAEDRVHRESREQMQHQRDAARDRGFDSFPQNK